MRDLREENPAAAARASSWKGRAWLARGTSPRRQRVLRATSWKDFTEEEVAAMSAAMRHSLTSRLAAKFAQRLEALAAEVSRRKKAEHQARQITAAMEEGKKAAKRREEALEQLAKEEAEELRRCRRGGCSPRLLASAEAPATPSTSLREDSPAATGPAEC